MKQFNAPSRSLILTGIIALAPLVLCSTTMAAQPWELRVHYWQDIELEPIAASDDTAVSRNEYFVGYTWQRDSDRLRASYAHQPVLIRRGEPGHNGYFHQLDLRYQRDFGATAVDVSVGVHGSSNMFKHGNFHGDALVGRFAVAHSLGEDLGVGLNGDYRFGRFRVYPTLQWTQTITAGGEIVANLPIAVHWHSAEKRWRVGIERYGEKWAALDSQREVDSAFYLEEWRFSTHWSSTALGKDRTLDLGIGFSFDTQVRHMDLVRGWITDDLDSTAFVLLGLRF